MQLSKRLLAVANLAAAGHCLADVGTDHGYIPIYLIEQGKFDRAIAMDVKQGPLLRAKENRDLHDLEEKMELRLSDGVTALRAGEADTVVIAGMGGALVIKILTEGAKVLRQVDTLILQPQSELYKVREFLQETSYRIEEEHMLVEDGKYYFMMRVRHGSMEPLTELEKKYGPLLLKEKNPVLREFLEREERKYLEIRDSLSTREGEKSARRLREVEAELNDIREAKESIA